MQAAGGLCATPAAPQVVSQPARAPGKGRRKLLLAAASSDATLAPPQLVQSGHPDALKRRLEAERRREQIREQVELAQQARWYEGPLPSNFLRVTTPEAFLEEVAADRLVVADFFVPWCVACRRFHPALIKLAAIHPDCTFLSVNGAEAGLHEFVASLGVDRLPYFQFYECGKLLSQFAANLSRIKQVRREIDICKERRMQQPAGSVVV